MDNNPKVMASDAGGVALPQGDRATHEPSPTSGLGHTVSVPSAQLRKLRSVLAFAEGFAGGFIGTDDDICDRLSAHVRDIQQARSDIAQAMAARSGETGTGSTEGNSAVPIGGAPERARQALGEQP